MEEKKLVKGKAGRVFRLNKEKLFESVRDLVRALKELHPDAFDKQTAIKKLLAFKTHYPDTENVFNQKNEMYEKGDENAPFFTEAYLYNLLGKEDARRLLALAKELEECEAE
jgi:hypothetical protein